MIYERGNAAKQWILTELDRRFGETSVRILDLACGDGQKWKTFLPAHPQISVVGIDTDAGAIGRGRELFSGISNVSFETADAQRLRADFGTYDVVTAFSSLEHVVRIDKFLDTVRDALKIDGLAYLNYDDGHFTSHNVKERLMVPVSQILAKIGIEGPYMKRVSDKAVLEMLWVRGFRVCEMRKHNLATLKNLARQYRQGKIGDEVLTAWFDFEDCLNRLLPPAQLAPIMGATIIMAQKT